MVPFFFSCSITLLILKLGYILSVSVGRTWLKQLRDIYIYMCAYRKRYCIDMGNTTEEGEEKWRIRQYFTAFSAFAVQTIGIWKSLTILCVLDRSDQGVNLYALWTPLFSRNAWFFISIHRFLDSHRHHALNVHQDSWKQDIFRKIAVLSWFQLG